MSVLYNNECFVFKCRMLGHGAFGSVYEAKMTSPAVTGHARVAVKVT